jgi:phosphopantothenoylcysteine decarboxylase/phosphopantothenate--cysteine ligase
MLEAVQGYVPAQGVFVATAAVADWRPAQVAKEKIKKEGSGSMPAIDWQENPDILAEVAASPRAQSGALYCVGFAAESQDLQALAQAKRMRKGVPLMVGNIGPATFGADDNALLLIDEHGSTEWPRNTKLALARQLVAEVARRLK